MVSSNWTWLFLSLAPPSFLPNESYNKMNIFDANKDNQLVYTQRDFVEELSDGEG